MFAALFLAPMLIAACGGSDNATATASDPADPFGGTFDVRIRSSAIECPSEVAQIQVNQSVVTGEVTHVRFNPFLITGSISFVPGAVRGEVRAKAIAADPFSYSINFLGTAARIGNRVSLSGSFVDSNGCDGAWGTLG